MNYIDLLIIITVSLVVLTIVFFQWVLPHIQGKKKSHCSNCPVGYDKKLKRDLNSYKKHRLDK